MARRPYLSLWRRKRPSALHLDNGLIEDLGAFLADRLAPQEDDERRLADALHRGSADGGEAALALAARLTARMKAPGDLAMTLTLFAALERSEPAYLILAQALDARAARLDGVADSERGGGPSSAALKRRAGLWRCIAREWWGRIDSSLLRQGQTLAGGCARVARAPRLRRAEPSPAGRPPRAPAPGPVG